MLRRLPDQRCDEAVRSAAGLRWSWVDVNQHAGCQFGDGAPAAADGYPTPAPTGLRRCASRHSSGPIASSSTSARAQYPLWNNHRFSRGAATTSAAFAACHRDLGLPSRAGSKGAAATTSAAASAGLSAPAATRTRLTGSRGNAARPAPCKAGRIESTAGETSPSASTICWSKRGWHEDPDGPIRGSDLHGQ